ncbi:MAG TPA: ABC transporter permease [Candidatus Acidoferrum sp.]|nr:ABC transporter permease [Candidatus Acidoferrum sp.]
MRISIHSVSQDAIFAVRQLGKSPGLTLLAVITLALGIGANAAMFTIADDVLLRPLPYPDAGRLVTVSTSQQKNAETSWLNYRDVRDQTRTLDEVGGYSVDLGVIQADDGSSSVAAPRLTPNLMRMLGVRPAMGRVFTEADGESGGPQVILLSDGLWRQKFHADPHIIGRTIRFNEKPETVIGVLPPSFRFPEEISDGADTAVWLPLQPSGEMLKERGYDFFEIVGRLKPGVRPAEAQAELQAIADRIQKADPGDNADCNSSSDRIRRRLRDRFARSSWR